MYLRSGLEPLYISLESRFLSLGSWEAGRCIPLEPRFLRPGKLGGWEVYTFRAMIPEAWEAGKLAGRLGGWKAGWLAE